MKFYVAKRVHGYTYMCKGEHVGTFFAPVVEELSTMVRPFVSIPASEVPKPALLILEGKVQKYVDAQTDLLKATQAQKDLMELRKLRDA